MNKRISQARQIKASEGFKDLNYVDGLQGARELTGDVHDGAVAEGTTYLEEDINHLRTQLQEIIGKDFWYDKASISIEELAGAARTLIQPVQLAGSVTFTAGSGDTGLLAGTAADQAGTTEGFLFGASATDGKHRVILRDKVTNMPIVDADENMVFGLVESALTDGDTITGGSDLAIKTYTDIDGVITAYAYDGEAEVVIPQRVKFADAAEDFAMINAGFANAVGSIELGDRMWVALDPATGIYDLTVETGDNSDLAIVKDDSLTKVINAIIAKLGKAAKEASASSDFIGLTYNLDGTVATDLDVEWDGDGVNTYYLDNDAGAGAVTALDAFKVLDNQLQVVEELAKNAGADIVTEILAADLAEATDWTIPQAIEIVTGEVSALTVYVNGQRLTSDMQVSGTSGDGSGDYTLTSGTTIAFAFNLLAGDLVVVDCFQTVEPTIP